MILRVRRQRLVGVRSSQNSLSKAIHKRCVGGRKPWLIDCWTMPESTLTVGPHLFRPHRIFRPGTLNDFVRNLVCERSPLTQRRVHPCGSRFAPFSTSTAPSLKRSGRFLKRRLPDLTVFT